MGKILIGSREKDVKQLNILFSEMGFKSSCSFNAGFGSIYAYQKLRINTINHKIFGDDHIIGVGTFIYNGKIDKEALTDIFNDFNGNNLHIIKKNIIGSFAIFICKYDNGYLFVDDGNTYNLYYVMENGEVLATNTYYHLAKITNAEIDEVRFVERTFKFSNLGNATPFKGIKRLLGNECLYFSNGKWEKDIFSMNRDIIEDRGLWETVEQNYKSLGNLFPISGTFLTGGQDSRLALAIMLQANMTPICYYGVGNSAITWTKSEDCEIVKLLAEQSSLEFRQMNWSESNTSLHEKLFYLNKYGELMAIYGCNKNIIDEFEKKIHVSFLSLGYFGEIYRNVETITNYSKDTFSLKEYLNDIYLPSALKQSYRGYDKLCAILYDELSAICHQKNLDSMKLTKKDHQCFDTEYRKSADIVMNNFANTFFYSFPFLSMPLYTNTSESMEYLQKNDSKLILDGLAYMAPQLLEIPFFSHVKKKNYDPQKHMLIDNMSFLEKIKEYMRPHLKNKAILSLLRKGYRVLQNDQKGLRELNESYNLKHEIHAQIKNAALVSDFNLEKLIDNHDIDVLDSICLMDIMVKSVKGIYN